MRKQPVFINTTSTHHCIGLGDRCLAWGCWYLRFIAASEFPEAQALKFDVNLLTVISVPNEIESSDNFVARPDTSCKEWVRVINAGINTVKIVNFHKSIGYEDATTYIPILMPVPVIP